ncbi:hypothetical protein ACL7TT_10230 [Microbulbifer sp. 2304DJ12-6]
MNKQEIQSAVAEFLKTEQGRALVVEILSAHIASKDFVLFEQDSG